MKKEIELKFRVKDFGPIRKKLKVLGAKLVWKGREENWFFDSRRFNFRKNDSALRIKISDRPTLTLKTGKHIERGVKIATGHEAEIGDPFNMRFILERLGMNRALRYSKKREHWKLGKSYVELDTLNPSNKYVEIEGSHASIQSIDKKLNLSFAKSTTKSYTEILGAR